MKVVLASKNPHKLVEISKITEKFGFDLVLQSELGVDIDVEETGTTFEENSLLKARAVMEATGLPALADDSGIAVDALNGEPGIYSARYGFDDSLDDWGRLLLLLKNTEHVPDGQRQAKFVCVISFTCAINVVVTYHKGFRLAFLQQYVKHAAVVRGCGNTFVINPCHNFTLLKSLTELHKRNMTKYSGFAGVILHLLTIPCNLAFF